MVVTALQAYQENEEKQTNKQRKASKINRKRKQDRDIDKA